MKCEEFEAVGLDAGCDASPTEAQRVAADEHAVSCVCCAALRDFWQAAHLELRALAQDTGAQEAPPRVEMRLRQQFRIRHHTVKTRRIAVMAAWAMAAAAVLAGAVRWINWHNGRTKEPTARVESPQPAKESAGIVPDKITPASETPAENAPVAQRRKAAKNAGSRTLVADNGLSGFTLLPGVLPLDTEYGEILRVRMQRGTLESFGLPVNEESAGEWIQVDLLVGDDGLPQAVRLSR